MTKVKGLNQLLAVGFAATVISFGAVGAVSAECTDAESMMSEGIAYECELGIKTVNDRSDLRMNLEGLMADGISFEDSVIAVNAKVINCDNKNVSVQSDSEYYQCEGVSLTSNRKSKENSNQKLASL